MLQKSICTYQWEHITGTYTSRVILILEGNNYRAYNQGENKIDSH